MERLGPSLMFGGPPLATGYSLSVRERLPAARFVTAAVLLSVIELLLAVGLIIYTLLRGAGV